MVTALAARLAAAIPAGDRLVLDTSVLIAYLAGGEVVSPVAAALMDEIVAGGRNAAVVSAVSAAELLVRPIATGPPAHLAVRTFLLGFPGLEIRSADLLVAAEAARIRAVTRASTADALVAATAVLTSSPWLVTNDTVLRDRLEGFAWSTQVLLLADFVAAPAPV